MFYNRIFRMNIMELNQATSLIKNENINSSEQTCWADLGCGSGLFTAALAHLLKPQSTIYAVDKNANALKKLQQQNNVAIEKIHADFIHDKINLSNLDGILMANSLHFVKDKVSFTNKIAKSLKADGYFLIAEYNMDSPNPWVPYPVSYHSLKLLFEKTGYKFIHQINELPSRYNRANIYSALIKR